MPTVKPIIFDGETNREMTDAEYAQWQIDAQAIADAQAAIEAQVAAKASARAKLAALGLTDDEIAALVGA
jgi:hypothetical protein